GGKKKVAPERKTRCARGLGANRSLLERRSFCCALVRAPEDGIEGSWNDWTKRMLSKQMRIKIDRERESKAELENDNKAQKRLTTLGEQRSSTDRRGNNRRQACLKFNVDPPCFATMRLNHQR
ncbi:unnamed protein product, partial [Ectocarpus sp. 12 AP-2014]